MAFDMIHEYLETVEFDRSDLPEQTRPDQVLLTTPDYFQVEYVINPHMDGNVGSVDPERARFQWDALRGTYDRLGLDVHVLPGRDGLPDMVFCANQTLPYRNPGDGSVGIVASRMESSRRAPEVDTFCTYFRGLGHDVATLSEEVVGSFEGMGDAIWHDGRHLLWGGYGFRTDRAAYNEISGVLGVRVLLLALDDPDFYHLDTCFSVLDEDSVVIYPGAFRPEGIELIRRFFPRVIEAPENEARELFACNAHCPDGRHVLIQRGCDHTNAALKQAGFEPIEVDTDEFLKSGGSVFCMKLMFW